MTQVKTLQKLIVEVTRSTANNFRNINQLHNVSKSSELVKVQSIVEFKITSDAIQQEVKDLDENKNLDKIKIPEHLDEMDKTKDAPNHDQDALKQVNIPEYEDDLIMSLVNSVDCQKFWTEIPIFINTSAEVLWELTLDIKKDENKVVNFENMVWAEDMPSNPSDSDV